MSKNGVLPPEWGLHQPQPGGAAPVDTGEEPEEYVDPRYAPAQNALADGDIEGAVAEYQKLVDANPADAEAAGGLAMAKVLQRTQGVDQDDIVVMPFTSAMIASAPAL